ncbi:MAG TPA: histidine phosphatase family protein [Burkholderiales bacterium]
MTRLVLLRHGETDWSRDKRIQGRSDIALSPAARATLPGLRVPARLGIRQAWTSPLARCTETAALLGWPDARRDDRLAEMRWGDWEGRRLADLRAEGVAAMQANEARGLDFRPAGGESPREVMARLRPWLAEVAQRDVPTLAFSHRGVIRALLALACGWDMRDKPPVRLQWDALHGFELAPDGTPAPGEVNLPLERRDAQASA